MRGQTLTPEGPTHEAQEAQEAQEPGWPPAPWGTPGRWRVRFHGFFWGTWTAGAHHCVVSTIVGRRQGKGHKRGRKLIREAGGEEGRPFSRTAKISVTENSGMFVPEAERRKTSKSENSRSQSEAPASSRSRPQSDTQWTPGAVLPAAEARAGVLSGGFMELGVLTTGPRLPPRREDPGFQSWHRHRWATSGAGSVPASRRVLPSAAASPSPSPTAHGAGPPPPTGPRGTGVSSQKGRPGAHLERFQVAPDIGLHRVMEAKRAAQCSAGPQLALSWPSVLQKDLSEERALNLEAGF